MRSYSLSPALLLILLLAAFPASAQSDFGDAPDGATASYPGFPGIVGSYPTLPATANSRFPGNVGIEHSATGLIWLGGATSVTTTEFLPNVTDLDVDDSGAFWWISLTGIPAGAVLDVPVSIAASAPAGPYYLNVLIDQNNDGEWKDTPLLREWAVRDRLIDQAPGTTKRQSVPVWWSSSLLILPKWVRISVTSVPLAPLMAWGADGWDGSMPSGFPLPLAIGETEDRFVGATYPGTAGPGGGPLPGPAGGGVPGGPGGGANGKGNPGPLVPVAGGACLMNIDCRPKNLTLPCGATGFVSCTVEYLSGNCPEISPGCNAAVSPTFVKHLRGMGPLAIVAPQTQCTKVGPGMRDSTLVFSVTFPPPCNQQIGRKQRWTFDLDHDPEGVYGTMGPDEREGIILSSAPPTCGNFIPEPPLESCDDGNLVSGDACSSDCKFPVYFANGILEPGEECDDGNMISGDGCSLFGLREFCGNMKVDPHEACDDGNGIDGDGCNRHCQFDVAPTCPNSVVDHVLEQCDDGNAIDGDGCSASCLSEGQCGNGWLDAGESCDDGNLLDEDGCSASCQQATVHVGGLRFAGDSASVSWNPVIAPLRRYDLLRGDLAQLHGSGGDLGAAGSTCLLSAQVGESAATPDVPAPGEAYFYLVRIDPTWLASATWEPLPPAGGAAGLRDAAVTPCD